MQSTYYDYLAANEGAVPFEPVPDQKSANVGSTPPPAPKRPVVLKIKHQGTGRAAASGGA